LAWNGYATCPPLSRAKALNSDVYQAEVRAAANIPNLRIIDMSDIICGRDTCEMEQGGIVKYRDSDHLTSSYVKSLANALQTQLLGSR
jgi:SGNH domain-containing protein